MEICLVRHGRTEGNLRRAFIGSTDLPVSPEGLTALAAQGETGGYPEVQAVYCSPLVRCRQTAAILYPDRVPVIEEGVREQHFGEFEDLTYDQITALPGYEGWGATLEDMEFPQGESRGEFRRRVLDALDRILAECESMGLERLAVVTHGGVIMTVMEQRCTRHKHFHDWWCDNGKGYWLRVLPEGLELLGNIGEQRATH